MHKIHIPEDVIDRVIARAGRLHVYETIQAETTAPAPKAAGGAEP
jgi:hypothetical protein